MTTPEPACASESGEAHDSLRDELVGLRPHEHVEAERIETAVGERMFGLSRGPMRIDRFDILARLGTGGVGVVYSAHDPDLDRHVALKLLRDSSRVGRVEHERLLREAHALARINHPNVVTVHEVGQLGDQVFVVMEFVEGQNLDAWARAAHRGWRETLAVYLQAGRGLSAAHAVGLVHRDFKPHNAIIGDDGRVRVVDFGLARGEASADLDDPTCSRDSSDSGSRASSTSLVGRFEATLTRPDALLGTPAYMSPEQCARRPVGPASDQWSFCVALYEALVGVRPFDGETSEALAARILSGVVAEPPRGVRVPAWLLATLRRGMSVAPRDRFGSMRELLAALERDPARTRRRWLLGATITALCGAVAALSLRQRSDPCSGSIEALASTWGPGHRAELEAHFGELATPAVAASLLGALDGYARRWQGMYEEACVTHQRGEQSDALLDKRMACLFQRRAALDGVIEGLGTTDATTFEDAMPAVYDIAPVHGCGDVELLEAALPLPANPGDRSTVKAAREELARATALADAGRPDDAHEVAVRWETRGRELDYPPLVAEAQLARGRIEMESDRSDASRPAATLRAAYLRGLEVGDLALAAEALLRLLYVDAIRPGGRAAVEELEAAHAMIASVPKGADVHGLYLNNAGTLAAARGDFPAALAFHREALLVRQSVPDPRRAEVLETRFNIAVMADDAAAQRTELEEVAAEFQGAFGSTHRRTLRTRMLLARAESDPIVALEAYAALCDAYELHHPEELPECLYDQGLRLVEARQLERAAVVLERATELFRATRPLMPPFQRVRHVLAHGQALACRGRHAEAVIELRAVLDEFADEPMPRWMQAWLDELEVVLGEALVAAERPSEAITTLVPAVSRLDELSRRRVDASIGRVLARARLALARAHRDALAAPAIMTPSTAATAVVVDELLDAAEPTFRASGPSGASQLDELRALHEALPVPP